MLPFFSFFNVPTSSNPSCFYCSSKTLVCFVGITKTEIQSVFFSGLWGSGTMGVFVILSRRWNRAKAPGDTTSVENHPTGCWNELFNRAAVTEHRDLRELQLGGRPSSVCPRPELGQKGRDLKHRGWGQSSWGQHSLPRPLSGSFALSQTCFLSLSLHCIPVQACLVRFTH